MFFLSQRPTLVAWRLLLNLGEQTKHWEVEVATAQKPRHLCMLSYTPSLYTQFSLQNYLTQQTFNVIVKPRASGLGCLVLSDARLQNERLTRPVYVHVDHPSTPLASRKMTLGGTRRVTFIYLFIDWLIRFSKDRISLSLGWTQSCSITRMTFKFGSCCLYLPSTGFADVCPIPGLCGARNQTQASRMLGNHFTPLGCIPCSI